MIDLTLFENTIKNSSNHTYVSNFISVCSNRVRKISKFKYKSVVGLLAGDEFVIENRGTKKS